MYISGVVNNIAPVSFITVRHNTGQAKKPEKVSKSQSIVLEYVPTNEPWHVISNNVAFDKCRFRQACAASFLA